MSEHNHEDSYSHVYFDENELREDLDDDLREAKHDASNISGLSSKTDDKVLIFEFSFLSSSHITVNTPKPLKDDYVQKLRTTIDGLKLELEMWQKAYKESQTKQSNRIQSLLQEFNTREKRTREQFENQKEQIVKDITHSVHLVEKELNSFLQLLDDSDVSVVIKKLSVDLSSGDIPQADDQIFITLHNLKRVLLKIFNVLASGNKDLLQQAESALSNKESEKNELQGQLSVMRQKFTSELNALKLELSDVYGQLSQYKETNGKLSDDLASVRTEKTQLESRAIQLSNVLHDKSSELENLKAENLVLKAKVESFEAEIQEEQDKRVVLQQEHISLKSTYDKLAEDYKILSLETKYQIQNFETRINEKNVEVENLQLKIRNILVNQEKEQAITVQIEELIADLNKQREEKMKRDVLINSLEEQLFEERQRVASLESQILSNTNQHKAETSEMKSKHDHEKEKLKQKFAMVEKELQDKASQSKQLVEESEKMSELLRQKIDNLQHQLDNLKQQEASRVEMEVHYNNVTSTIKSMAKKMHIDSTRESNESMLGLIEQHISLHQDKIQSLQKQLTSAEQERRLIETSNERLEIQLKENKAITVQLKKDLENAIQKMEIQIKTDIQLREEERQKFKANIAMMKSELHAKTQALEELSHSRSKDYEELHRRYESQYKIELEVLQRKVEEYMQKLLHYESKLKTLEQENQITTQKLERERETNSTLNKEVIALKDKISEKSYENASLRDRYSSDIKRLSDEVALSKRESDEMKVKNSPLQQNTALVTEETGRRKSPRLSISYSAPTEGRNSLSSSPSNLHSSQIKQLEEELEHYATQQKQASSDIEDMLQLLNAKAHYNKNLETTIQKLIEEKNRLKHQLDHINTRINDGGAGGEAHAMKSHFEKELDDSNKKTHALAEALEKSNQQHQNLLKKYKAIKDKYFKQSLRQNELQNYLLKIKKFKLESEQQANQRNSDAPPPFSTNNYFNSIAPAHQQQQQQSSHNTSTSSSNSESSEESVEIQSRPSHSVYDNNPSNIQIRHAREALLHDVYKPTSYSSYQTPPSVTNYQPVEFKPVTENSLFITKRSPIETTSVPSTQPIEKKKSKKKKSSKLSLSNTTTPSIPTSVISTNPSSRRSSSAGPKSFISVPSTASHIRR